MRSHLPLIIPLSILALACPLHGQYFGQNKIQYQDFHFKVMHTRHFNVYYYPQETDVVRDAGRMLERWNMRYTRIFNRNIALRQPVILYWNQADFLQTNAVEDIIPQATGGVTEGQMNRVVIPLTGIYSENDHVLGHELTHAFQYEIIKSLSTGGLAVAQQIPLWFIEGMAEYCSLGSRSELTSMWMRDAVLNHDVPTFNKIGRTERYFPYRYGQAIWSYIGGTYGDASVGKLMNSLVKDGWRAAWKDVIGINVDTLSSRWRAATRAYCESRLKGRTPPSALGKPVIEKTSMNLNPEISPDGKYLSFLAERDLFSIDLFLADASSGRILKKLVSSESDRHFDAVRMFNSAGAWSPDSRKFAFVVFKHGKNSIVVLDVAKGESQRIISIKDVDEIGDLGWSPDGKQLVLSGSRGGINDLYLHDFSSGTTTQLTDDLYADIQPTFSPDGKTIAFVTDQGAPANFDSLHWAPMRIGILDLATRQTSLLSITAWAAHTNPQFSPDGKSLYCVADPDGFNDIYRYSFDTKEFTRITRIATGVSGITELSPALSVAQKTGTMVFSVFDKAGYKIHSMEPRDLAGSPFATNFAEYLSNVSLPPGVHDGGIVNAYLDSTALGLITRTDFSSTGYHPRLSLLYVGQLYAGVSADPLGVGVGGGASFLFSDILGNNLVGMNAQIDGGLKDLGGEVYYLNRTNRINWGGFIGHVPYLSTTLASEPDTITVNGQKTPADRVSIVDQRVFEDRAALTAIYPLTANRRFEFTGGYTHISYDYDAVIYNTLGNNVVEQTATSLPVPRPIDLAEGSMAYVGDFTDFGFTGPVKGRRFRFEADPTVGSLQYVTALADYRQYFFVKPFTIALRALHYGRYLRDAESDRLSPLYLGYEDWVRGYSIYSFDLSQSGGDFSKDPEFNRLLGTRIGVVNAELRFPLLGTQQFGMINFPYLPTELAAFLDGGAAWTRDSLPVLELARKSSDRIPVFSAGGAARFNLFGFAVLQLYMAYPFQRDIPSWQWGLLFSPGY